MNSLAVTKCRAHSNDRPLARHVLSIALAVVVMLRSGLAQEELSLARVTLEDGERSATLPVQATSFGGDIQGFVLALRFDPEILRIVEFAPAGDWLAAGPPDFVVPYGTESHPLRSAKAEGETALMVLIDLSEEPSQVVPALDRAQTIAELEVEIVDETIQRESDIRTEIEFVDDEVTWASNTPGLRNHLVIAGEDYFRGGEGAFRLSLRSGGIGEASLGFRRGDANASGNVELSDAIYVFNYLFLGGEAPDCLDAADTNDDGSVDLSDGIGVLLFLFVGGRPPPDPGPRDCGVDPTDDRLPACTHTAC